jgi:hypothetical protein
MSLLPFQRKLLSHVLIQRFIDELGRFFHLLAVLCATVSALTLLDLLFHFPRSVRVFLLIFSLGGFFSYAVWSWFRFLFRRTDVPAQIARLDQDLSTGDLFINAHQLALSDRENPFTEELIRLAEKQAEKVRWRGIIRKKDLLRSLSHFAAIVFFLAGSLILFPEPLTFSGLRVLFPWSDLENRMVRLDYTVRPGHARVAVGSDLVVSLETGDPLLSCIIFYRSGQKEFLTEEMKFASVNRSNRSYEFRFREVNRDIQYHVRMVTSLRQEVISPNYRIQVISPPMISSLRIQYLFPQYTGLESVFQDGNGHVEALRGTEVRVTATASAPLRYGALMLDGKPVRAQVNRDQFLSVFTLLSDGAYFFRIMDQNGLTNQMPVLYTVRVLDDKKPDVKILQPGKDIDLPDSMLVKLEIKATDDIRLKALHLRHYVVRNYSGSADRTNSKEIPIPQEKDILVQSDFSLKGMNLMPGDVVHYFAVADDGFPFDQTHKVASETYRIRFPSMADLYRQADKEEGDVLEAVRQIREKQEEYLQKMEEIREQMRKGGTMDYISRTQLESLLGKQQELMEQATKAADDLEKAIAKMEKNRLASRQIVEKMREIEKMMQDVVTKEMKEAMDKIQESLKALQMTEKERKEFASRMDQQEVLRKLDNTLKMLKEVRQNRKLNELARRADEMLRKQNEINRETSEMKSVKRMDEGKLQEIRNKQAENQKMFDALKLEMEKAAQEFAQSDKDFAQKMRDLASLMERKQTSAKMDRISSALSRKEMESAKSDQESVAQDLQELKEKMEQSVSEKQEKNLQKLFDAFEKVIFSLLAIADEQAEISESVKRQERAPFSRRSFEPVLPQAGVLRTYSEFAEKQLLLERKLQSDKKFIRAEFEKSLVVPEEFYLRFDAISLQMQSAMRYLAEDNPFLASRSSESSVRSLHELILQIMDIHKNVKDQAENMRKQGLSEKMERMSQDQMNLNNATEQLMGKAAQEGMSPEMQQYLKELAFQQEMIQRAFEDTVEESKGQAGQMLGDMASISKEMEETAKKMREGQLDREIIERQQRILKKLLDSQRALKQKEESPERKAEQADKNLKARPGEESQEPKAKDKNQPAKVERKEKTPSEYEKTIQNYLRSLGRNE